MELIRLDPDALQWREVEGETIAVDLRNSICLTVNASGAVLWPLLARGATLTELADALVQRWTLEADQARGDAQRFVAWLTEQGLVLTSPEPG
jgi:hypothetical protein